MEFHVCTLMHVYSQNNTNQKTNIYIHIAVKISNPRGCSIYSTFDIHTYNHRSPPKHKLGLDKMLYSLSRIPLTNSTEQSPS
jgi:hypothetical protein